jgi:fucose 4-O-acetylase-like acetyltransferase
MTAAAREQKHIEWIEVARGIGIILVVYFHVARGLATSGVLVPTPAMLLLDRIVYSFHMPLFFLLSGLVFGRSLKKPLPDFLRGRWWTLLYPYLLWTAIYVALAMLMHQQVNRPIHWHDLLLIGWFPLYHFWFLAALFVCHIFGLLARISPWAIAVVAIFCALIPLPWPGTNLANGATNVPYFAVGLLVPGIGRLAHLRPAQLVVIAVAASFVFGAYFTLGNALSSRLDMYILALLGIFGIVTCSMLIGERMPWLRLAGRMSMVIFVLHILVASGIRIMIKMVGGVSPYLLLPALTVAGIAVPIMIGLWAGRRNLSVPLGLARPITA